MNTLERGQEMVQIKCLAAGALGFGFELFLWWWGNLTGTDMQVTTGEEGKVHESGLQKRIHPPFASRKSHPQKAFQPPRILCSAPTLYCNEKQVPL